MATAEGAEQLTRAGYEVTVVDVEAPWEVTQDRVARRWREAYVAAENGTATGRTATLGGRWVARALRCRTR